MSNSLRSRDALPFDFTDSIKIRGVPIEDMLNEVRETVSNANISSTAGNSLQVGPDGGLYVPTVLAGDATWASTPSW